MNSRLLLFFKYIIFWYLYFVLSKFLFLFYHFDLARNLPVIDWFKIFFYGFKLDISTVGYIMILPSLIIIVTSFFKTRILYYFLAIYTLFLLIIIVFLTLADLQLYSYWGFRLDSTPLLYMDNPKAMFASVTLFSVILLIISIIMFVLLFYILYLRWIANKIKDLSPDIKSLFIFPVLSALLFIPIRGGFDVAAVNVSTAYFNKNQFANHAAINCIWNLGFSLTELNNAERRFNAFDLNVAEKMFKELKKDSGQTKILLSTKRPNIIIIALESFTSKVIEPLGGIKGITPNINGLIHEGIFFDHFYASGDRTDKAMVALLGAYPAQPTTNIIKYPYKSEKLTFMTKVLKPFSYHSSFYFGGSIDFANYRTLLNLAGFDHIVSKDDFGADGNNSKWGAWDHVVLKRLLDETPDNETGFFKFLFTLTSHPPYVIPTKPLINKDDEDSKFLNSVNYTDKSVGDFIKHAKKKKWWENTLIILIADHGIPIPGNTPNFAAEKFSIPMLWLGGALGVTDTIIHTYADQTDISKTIFAQMDVPYSNGFSKNIFSSDVKSYAFYTFNNGFGFVSGNYQLIYDNTVGSYIIETGKFTPGDKNTGKAYLQMLIEDFIRK